MVKGLYFLRHSLYDQYSTLFTENIWEGFCKYFRFGSCGSPLIIMTDVESLHSVNEFIPGETKCWSGKHE